MKQHDAVWTASVEPIAHGCFVLDRVRMAGPSYAGLGSGSGLVGEGSSELGSELQNCWVAFEHAGDGGCFFGETFRRLLFGFGVRELVIRDGVRTSNGKRRRRRFGDYPGNMLAARLLLNGCLPIARAISARHQG